MKQVSIPGVNQPNTKIRKSTKKKILLLSDDLRMHSGIATVSKDIVMETIDRYDWCQIGGAINHPDQGKIIDLKTALENWLNPEGESVEETTGDLPWEKKEEKSTNSNPAKATQTDDISKAFDDLFSE